MDHIGKTHLLITFVVSPDKVDEADRLVASHGSWIAQTHYKDGDKALLSYTFSMGPELGNPLDPSSEPTGNTRYVINEIYESEAGITDHWQQVVEPGLWGHNCSALVGRLETREDRCLLLLVHQHLEVFDLVNDHFNHAWCVRLKICTRLGN